MVTLIAMSPVGETFVVRGPAGDSWLVQPEMLGGVTPLGSDEVDYQVARRDLVRIQRTFASWRELDDFRQQIAAEATPSQVIDVDEFDAEDVRRLLAVARGWVTEGRAADAVSLALDLMERPVVRADDEAVKDLVRFVRETAVRPARVAAPGDVAKAAAIDRWRAMHVADGSVAA